MEFTFLFTWERIRKNSSWFKNIFLCSIIVAYFSFLDYYFSFELVKLLENVEYITEVVICCFTISFWCQLKLKWEYQCSEIAMLSVIKIVSFERKAPRQIFQHVLKRQLILMTTLQVPQLVYLMHFSLFKSVVSVRLLIK